MPNPSSDGGLAEFRDEASCRSNSAIPRVLLGDQNAGVGGEAEQLTRPGFCSRCSRLHIHRLNMTLSSSSGSPTVASTKVVCDGPGEQRALHVEAATA